jgi:hypothetical protein
VRARTIALLGGIAIVPLAVLLPGCGDDGPGDTARFCTEVLEHREALTTPPETLADVDAFIALYRQIGRVVPLAIEPHWEALTRAYETANTLDPTDPESEQAALAQAYATERSAVAVHDFLMAWCAVDIGPVATIVPGAPADPEGSVPSTAPGG